MDGSFFVPQKGRQIKGGILFPKRVSLFDSPLRGMVGLQRFALLPDKGGILFPKRIPPLDPPEKGEGRSPRPPALAVPILKDCTRCAVQVRCTWLRHGSSASRYRQQPRPTPWGASDGGSAADCGAHSKFDFAVLFLVGFDRVADLFHHCIIKIQIMQDT